MTFDGVIAKLTALDDLELVQYIRIEVEFVPN